MSSYDRPLILVSNDDSYQALGLHTLMERMTHLGDVIAVSPEQPQSGMGMAITVNGAMRVTETKSPIAGARLFKCNGTPTDCVKLAMHTVLDRKPDLVVTGINHGSNTAINVLYSGTMGAAFEGCAFGVPSIGYSLTDHFATDFQGAVPFVDKITRLTLESGLPQGICLNVNVPHGEPYPTQMRFVRECRGKWSDEYEKYIDPYNRPFYLLKGEFINLEPEAEDTDDWCVHHGIVSIVAEQLDRTAPPLVPVAGKLPDWLLKLAK